MGQTHQVLQTLFALCSTTLQLLSRLQKVEGADSVFAAGMDDPRSVIIQVPLCRVCTGGHHQFCSAVVLAWQQRAIFLPYC
jgi:hypothetical protein